LGRQRRINDNIKPFTDIESHFIDARFFEDGCAPKETVPSIISLTGKVAQKMSFKCQKRMFLNNNIRRKKANRKICHVKLREIIFIILQEWLSGYIVA